MLAGCTPWPQDVAKRYRDLGYWQGITLTDLLARAIRRAPDKTALVHGGERISYRALGETVDRLACGFIDAGIRPLDRVVVQLPNIPEFVYTYFALARIGAIPVTALRAHRHTEVGHFLRASGAVAYVIPDAIKGFDYRAMAQELAPKAPALRTVFVVGEPAPRPTARCRRCSRRRQTRARLSAVRADPAEVATMLLSGGTTSLSKLIPRTHDDYVLNARLCGAAGGFDESTVLMAILPLGHNYNLASPGMLGAFYYGGTVVLAPSGEAADVFGLVERERVTTIAAVVPLISALARFRRARPLRSVFAQGDPERRRPPRAGAAQPPARALRLHAAGNLRHRRRAHQHDAARRSRRPAARKLGRAGVRRRRDHRRRRRRPRGRRRRSRRAA